MVRTLGFIIFMLISELTIKSDIKILPTKLKISNSHSTRDLSESNRFKTRLNEVSEELGIPSKWLIKVIYIESAGTFSASTQNPYSNAVGLIQFMPTTAKRLGTTTEKLKNMSRIEQLDYVLLYFKRWQKYTGEFKSESDLYLTVFFPIAVNKEESFILKTKTITAECIARANSGFDTDNNLEITKLEVINYLNTKRVKNY